MATDEVDLYADIFAPAVEADKTNDQVQEIQSKVVVLEAKLKVAQEEILKGAQQNEKLKKVQKILARNISSLYRTAVAEIKRKDEAIQKLQADLDRAKLHQINRVPAVPERSPSGTVSSDSEKRKRPASDGDGQGAPKVPRNDYRSDRDRDRDKGKQTSRDDRRHEHYDGRSRSVRSYRNDKPRGHG